MWRQRASQLGPRIGVALVGAVLLFLYVVVLHLVLGRGPLSPWLPF